MACELFVVGASSIVEVGVPIPNKSFFYQN
jgi:hypothetical protein